MGRKRMEILQNIMEGETMDNRKIQSQTDQDGDRTASDEACQKPFKRKTKERK